MTEQKRPHWRVVVNEILDAVADEYGVTRDEILGQSRIRRFVVARQEAMARIRERGFSSPEVGMIFKRDHTTVLAAHRKARKRSEAAE